MHGDIKFICMPFVLHFDSTVHTECEFRIVVYIMQVQSERAIERERVPFMDIRFSFILYPARGDSVV